MCKYIMRRIQELQNKGVLLKEETVGNGRWSVLEKIFSERSYSIWLNDIKDIHDPWNIKVL